MTIVEFKEIAKKVINYNIANELQPNSILDSDECIKLVVNILSSEYNLSKGIVKGVVVSILGEEGYMKHD